MKDSLTTLYILVAIFGLIGAGGGVLIWLAPVPTSELTTAQSTLIELADTAVKGALGAFFGFAGTRLATRSGRRRRRN